LSHFTLLLLDCTLTRERLIPFSLVTVSNTAGEFEATALRWDLYETKY
jgi:hypothetical protein